MPRIVEKEVVVQKVVQSGITEEEVQRIQWQARQSGAAGVFVGAVSCLAGFTSSHAWNQCLPHPGRRFCH